MQVMIRYRVKPDQVERNLELTRAVYEELEAAHPDGLRYVTFQLEDKVSFVVFVEAENGVGSVTRLESFQRYRSTLEERCDEPPNTTFLSQVGAYSFS